MAKEILEITRTQLKDGRTEFHLAYLYTLSPPITIGGTPVVLSHPDTLDPILQEYLLDEQQLQGLRDGLGFVAEDRIHKEVGQTNQDMLALAQLRYQKGLDWIEEQRSVYAHAGDTYDAQ